MKIKLIDFGYENAPKRAHDNDAGADVFAPESYTVKSGETGTRPLGFGVIIPDGYAGYIFPRSGLSIKGLVCELPPIDSGYRGQVHAIINNHSQTDYRIKKGDRIGQLVIMPVIIADYITEESTARGFGAFSSTGR